MSMPEDALLMPTYAPAPVRFSRGEGSWLWDEEGKAYLDFLSGLAVTSLGHCHPEVAEALRSQAGKLWHVSNLFRNELAPRLAARLDALVGGGGKVFFSNSGAEANEAAIKLARRFGGRGRHRIVAAYNGFHGRTLAALAATGQPAKWEGFEPLPAGFSHVPFGDAAAAEQALDRSVAAVMIEVIQGEGGVIVAPEGYLSDLRSLCDEHGALLIVDEVQTGLGRSGKWFAFQHEALRPDVVTIAKALGNGMPIGACWARAEVADLFSPGDHATTYGGQPLACSAALATLAVMEREDVPRRAAAAGAKLAARAAALGGVAAVRGRGLLLGLVLGPSAPSAPEVARRCLELGLVVNAIGSGVIRLAPSLLVSDEEIDQAIAMLGAALGGERGG